MAMWIWLFIAALFLLGFLKVRFRTLLGVALGAGAAAGAAGLLHWGWLPQVGVFVALPLALEAPLKVLLRALRREKEKSGAREKVGKIGKIRDVVRLEKDVFLMHVEGGDWIARPERPGTVKLGDRVEVVGVAGKKLVVRKAS